jgi:hypothetical protein
MNVGIKQIAINYTNPKNLIGTKINLPYEIGKVLQNLFSMLL